ncbi:MAG: hypothetical protein AAFX50_07990 [Acidobacteriota bacterium]
MRRALASPPSIDELMALTDATIADKNLGRGWDFASRIAKRGLRPRGGAAAHPLAAVSGGGGSGTRHRRRGPRRRPWPAVISGGGRRRVES